MSYAQQQSGPLPSIELLEASLANRDQDSKYAQRQVRQAAHVLAAGLICPPSPPPSSYTVATPYTYPAASTSAPNALSYASKHQDPRREYLLEKDKEQAASVSLPSIHEALEAAQGSYNAQSTTALAAQPYLPYSPTTPNCSRKIRPYDHNPTSDRQTPPASRPPTSYHSAGREQISSPRQPVGHPAHIVMQHPIPQASVVPADVRQPSYRAKTPRSPTEQHRLAAPLDRWQQQPRSISANTQDIHSLPPAPRAAGYAQQQYPLEHGPTSQHSYLATSAYAATRPTYFPNNFSQTTAAWKPREVEHFDDHHRLYEPREPGPSYGESVKRHLEVFDLESALNDIADGGKVLLDFSMHYRERAHATQRTGPLPGSTPHLAEIEDMMKHNNRIQDSLTRLRDVIQEQQAALLERSREQQLKAVNAFVPEAGASEDNKDGFAGSDPKKRRGRAAAPGRCHSCNRAETPEWRRGPDGARTLCNACGLHYAKLTRKLSTNKSALSNSNLAPRESD